MMAPAAGYAGKPVLLPDLHEAWAWVTIVANALAGCWALAAHRWAPLQSPLLWWFTGFAELAIFGQVLLGVAMVAGQDRTVDQFHMFYGFVALFAVGILYAYRTQLAAHRYLLYGFGGLFLMGLGIRAMLIGPS
jgi:hypothetical protein